LAGKGVQKVHRNPLDNQEAAIQGKGCLSRKFINSQLICELINFKNNDIDQKLFLASKVVTDKFEEIITPKG
jgi:hypothetical protein